MLLLLALLITSTDCTLSKNDVINIMTTMNEHRLSVNVRPLKYNADIDHLGEAILSKCPNNAQDIEEKLLGFLFLKFNPSSNYNTIINKEWFSNKAYLADGCKTEACPNYKEIIAEVNNEMGCSQTQCSNKIRLICLFKKQKIMKKKKTPPNPKTTKATGTTGNTSKTKPGEPTTTLNRGQASSSPVAMNYSVTVKIFSCIIILFYFLLK